LRFRLLGPVDALAGDVPVPLGGPQQRHLLAALLFDGGLAATFETLNERLWDEDPPAGALAALDDRVARLLSTLRAAGVDVAVERRPGGYTTRAPVEAVDLYRFRALAEAARGAGSAGQRADLLDEALGLWRGDALAGIPGEWAQRARDGLERRRLAALASWAEAALALGRAAEVVDRLAGALTRHPLAEPLIAVQMRALHAAGLGAEAVGLYARIAAPGRVLRDAYARVLP
jgi:DNA-binding SARP family transcriptional activator